MGSIVNRYRYPIMIARVQIGSMTIVQIGINHDGKGTDWMDHGDECSYAAEEGVQIGSTVDYEGRRLETDHVDGEDADGVDRHLMPTLMTSADRINHEGGHEMAIGPIYTPTIIIIDLICTPLSS